MNNNERNNFQNPNLIPRNEGSVEDNRGNSEEFFIGIREEVSPQEDKFVSLKRYEVKYFDCGHSAYLVGHIGGICPKCHRLVCKLCLKRCTTGSRVFCVWCMKKDKDGNYYCNKHARINSIKILVLNIFELPFKIFDYRD